MFDFLNKVFGRAVEIEVVGYKAPEVTFKSAEPLDLGVKDVYATIAGVKLKARVQVTEVGLETSHALWLAPTEALAYLDEIYAYKEKRKFPRYARSLRVRSPLLESFQGTSLDLSQDGLRMEGRGELVPGSLMPIQMDLDDERQTQLAFETVIRWSAPAVEDGLIVAGLEFVHFDTSHPDFSFYVAFLERLAHTQKPLAEQ